jgi:hypothetical protein
MWRPQRIDQNDVHIAGEWKMLKAVIEKKNVDWLFGLDALAFGKAIFADPEFDAALEAMLHQLDLVACAASALVSTAQNGDALPFS